jgi:putative aldouronate transport system permease protein
MAPPALTRLARDFRRDFYLILLVLPAVVYYLVFHYLPMYGIVIAFKSFSIARGISGSPWAGLKWFREFFGSFYFGRIVSNTVVLSLSNLAFSFPAPIVFALLLNELRNQAYKRVVQTVSYLPHFVSMVVVVGIMVNFLSPVDGIVGRLLVLLGGKPINFMFEPRWFRSLYVISGIWQNTGWNAIVYIAAIASINPELYEAAYMDGAGRWGQLFHVTLPGILPTVVILLILNFGNVMSVGFEKVLLMYNPSTYETADIISTYVYRRGVLGSQYSFGAAVGFFNSVVNVCLLLAVNRIARRAADISLW